MLRRGMTANTTGSVSGIQGEGETRPRKTDKLLRILVVDDNRDAADSLRLLLEFSGHEVAVAYSGREGLQAAEQYQPDVVLCDAAWAHLFLDARGSAWRGRHGRIQNGEA